MTDWLHAEYRDFDVMPRAMLCTGVRGTYYFVSRFEAGGGAYADSYEAFRIRPLGEGEACLSWFGLESRALERLPDIPVREFPFDVAARAFLPYDSIAPMLGE
jgi:hypothetical protein